MIKFNLKEDPLLNPPRKGEERVKSFNFISNHKNKKQDIRKARFLRKNMSPIEKLLWKHLSYQSKHVGLKFRKQHPINPYIVDFVCLSRKLIIEIDGVSHIATKNADNIRSCALINNGYKIIRFSNQQVIENVEAVVETILKYALGEIKTEKEEEKII